MNKESKPSLPRYNLAFIFSFAVFLVILFCIAALTLFDYELSKADVGESLSVIQGGFTIGFAIIISIVIGVFIFVIINYFVLNPMYKIMDAMEELRSGNFDIRIEHKGFSRPKDLVNFYESFNKTAEELGKTEVLHNNFIDSFSHEFKTPIASIGGFAALLKEGFISPEDRSEYLQIIIDETGRLSALSDNVLNLSRVEWQSSALKKDWFNLNNQLEHMILMMDSRMNQKDINLRINMDYVKCYGSEELLGQVWTNILDNAIKFSPQGSVIEIELLDLFDSIGVKISDEGCGMDEETRERIFERFYQAESSRTTPGYGLGMTVVQKVINVHKGRISVESTLGRGTLIEVVLPKE